jgi:MarR family transcriptional regulator for hemolysin
MNIINNESVSWQISKAKKLLKNNLHNQLKNSGISSEQLKVLNLIISKQGCNQKELSESSDKDRSAITRILNILEINNLVKRETSPRDKREFLLYATEKGQDIYNEAVKVLNRELAVVESLLSKKELKQLKVLLNKLISKLI